MTKRIMFVGPSGIGKTTLAQHLNGLLWPNKGTIKIDDFFIDGNDAKLQKKKKKGIKKTIYIVR